MKGTVVLEPSCRAVANASSSKPNSGVSTLTSLSGVPGLVGTRVPGQGVLKCSSSWSSLDSDSDLDLQRVRSPEDELGLSVVTDGGC
jgi:hypothetical protein